MLSVAVAVTLVALKIGVWWFSRSVALLASALDSGLDLIASLTTFLAVRYAAAPPDREHRFGHGKAEAFASLMQAGLVFASAALIFQQAFVRLIRSQAIERESLGDRGDADLDRAHRRSGPRPDPSFEDGVLGGRLG